MPKERYRVLLVPIDIWGNHNQMVWDYIENVIKKETDYISYNQKGSVNTIKQVNYFFKLN